MAGHKLQLAFRSKKDSQNGSATSSEPISRTTQDIFPVASSGDDEPLLTPRRLSKTQTPASPDLKSYSNSFRSSRTASMYSLSRDSLSSQLSQLTSLALPNATSLSTSISSIPTAPIAATILGHAADQIKIWLAKATEVLSGLDAEDDVEWAAAGGREGLGGVDTAIGKFEGLIGVYVKAIEDLQERDDIPNVPAGQQKDVVDQMEGILMGWDTVRRSLKTVKAQVELAMEWEELWNHVLGDIGLEMENLSRLVFEMEEARHKALLSDPILDTNGTIDMQELDTIIEEGEKETFNHRTDVQSSSSTLPDSPISPGLGIASDDTRLLALIARMQPLRASLDFLPMTLSSYQTRAEPVLPTACIELETRRRSLERKWQTLEADAEGLRQELGEDRWVVVFRNVGRQALKLCESVERAINKLQEAIDVGTQHSNPPLLTKKVEAYEQRKSHIGLSIEKILVIIGNGVAGRMTVNGEILRLQLDTKTRWESVKADMKDMDLALDDLAMSKNQQLRDSISSIVSMDRSATSVVDAVGTPGSSPASSVIMGPSNGVKREKSPGTTASSRRSSIGFNNATRPNGGARRNFTMPPGTTGSTQIPRKNPISRSFSSEVTSRGASPAPYATSATPTPGGLPQRPSLSADNKPRWNSSPKVEYFEFGQKPRHLPFATPPAGHRSSMAFRSPMSIASYGSSGFPLSSPLGRSSPALSPASATSNIRPRLSSGVQTSMGMRQPSLSSSLTSTDVVKANEKTPPNTASSKRQSIGIDSSPGLPGTPTLGESPSARPRPQRPSTSLASSRRISMLPLPKSALPSLANGRDSVLGTPDLTTGHGRQTSLGHRSVSNGRDSTVGPTATSNGKENRAFGRSFK